MTAIISTLMTLIAMIAMKIMSKDRRLTDGEFTVGSLALAPATGFLADYFWERWVDHCARAGLRPFPDITYDLYSPWELQLSPLIVTALIYASLVFLLSLAHWPEGLSKAEVKDWQMTKLRRSRWVLIPLVILDLAYLAFRWFPVWWQWL